MNSTGFFIYARKSTDDADRQIRSIGDQIAELQELVKKEDLHVVDVLVEKQSAKQPGRPVFGEMLDRIERGEASGILAWHPDRLARNSLDGGRIIYLVDTGKITALKFPTFPFEPNAQGKFMLSIMFGQSKYYVDNLSENIRRGQRQKLRGGVWPMVAPVGFLNDRSTRTIYPDPERGPLVRKAFEFYASGMYTLDRLTVAVNGLGLTNRQGEPLSRAQYHRLLSNPIYYGLFEYGGERYEGTHEPIVTKRLFDVVQEVATRKSKPKAPRLKPYLYRGVFRCGECGCVVTTETQKGHNYLRCTKRKGSCSQPYVREELVAEQVAATLRRLSLTGYDADWIVLELEAERNQCGRRDDAFAQAMVAEVKASEAKLDRLMGAYLDGSLDLAEYRSIKAKLLDEKQQNEERLTLAKRNKTGWFEPAIRFVNEAKQAQILGFGSDRQEQRDFLKKVGSNLVLRERMLNVSPRGAWETVADQARFAQRDTPAPLGGAGGVGETDPDCRKRRR